MGLIADMPWQQTIFEFYDLDYVRILWNLLKHQIIWVVITCMVLTMKRVPVVWIITNNSHMGMIVTVYKIDDQKLKTSENNMKQSN